MLNKLFSPQTKGERIASAMLVGRGYRMNATIKQRKHAWIAAILVGLSNYFHILRVRDLTAELAHVKEHNVQLRRDNMIMEGIIEAFRAGKTDWDVNA